MKTDMLVSKSFITASLLVVLGIALRLLGLGLVSLDMKIYLLGWYDSLAAHGFPALREPFSNYTPPYLYLLWLAAQTGAFLPKVTAIKLISILFDLLNALVVYRIVRLVRPRSTALLAAAGFLLLPTLLLNSGWWGQADAIYVFFLLASIYFLMRSQPLPAMLALGISFSFKAQAVFLAPLVLLLILSRKLSWGWLLMIPGVYLVMVLPAALAGRPLADLFTIYLGQAGDFQELSKNAPNPYAFFPNEAYLPAVIGGIILAALICLLWVGVFRARIKDFPPRILLLCGLVSVTLVPFFLPKMHDRYFYPADALSYILAFFWPGTWLPALGYQFISGLVYFVFLSGMHPDLAHRVVQFAAILNSALIIGLLIWQWRVTGPSPAGPDRPASDALIP